ncbi:MAG: hypothetical protein ABIV39_08260, partial [Verrucomicrobiota bacterium]
VVQIENWRGRSGFKKVKRDLAAQGEKLDWQSFVPPPIPNESNFASIPIFAKLFDYQRDATGQAVWRDTNALNENVLSIYVEGFDDLPSFGLWILGRKTDLQEWQDYYRKSKLVTDESSVTSTNPAADILAALAKSDDAINQLEKASELPFSRLPIQYDESYSAQTPHLSKLKAAAQNLNLRASAHLELGQIDSAAKDVILNLRLANLSRDEPFLISHLVRVAMTTIDLHPLWEGLLDQRWDEQHLKAFQAELEKFDYIQSLQLALRGERVSSLQMIEMSRTNRNMFPWLILGSSSQNPPLEFDLDSLKRYSSKKLQSMIWHSIPDGWFYQNQSAIADTFQQMLAAVDPVAHRVSLSKIKVAADLAENRKGFYPYFALAQLLLPAHQKAAMKLSFEQTAVELAIVACALERYRLVIGVFPEDLAALSPQFLEKIPHDIITGEPLKYRQTGDGKFILYSVGWNGTDDGGTIAIRLSSRNPQMEEGDWVWQYSTNSPPTNSIKSAW